MSCNEGLDNRGALLTIYHTDDTVFDKSFTFTDGEGDALDLSAYTDFIFRIFTETPTEFTEQGGDMSVASNVVSCDFNIDLEKGSYDYQFVGVASTGEKEFIRGKIKIS